VKWALEVIQSPLQSKALTSVLENTFMDFKNQRSHELYYLLTSWLEFYIMQSCIKPYVIFCKLCNSYSVLDISIYLSVPIIYVHIISIVSPGGSNCSLQTLLSHIKLSILVEYGSGHFS